VQVNIKNLIDDVQCYQTVREPRWPEGIACPSCESIQVIKRGFDDTEPARQRYECHDCHRRFDDLTDTIFARHHQPLKVWILCLYFMCVFHGFLPPRPRESCHALHAKPAIQSTGRLPPNPREACHPLQERPALVGAARRWGR
jgi:transposase-like protein